MAGMICNKNGIPDDPRPPRVTSGVRLGSPAATTRGFKEGEMRQVAAWIDRVLSAGLAGPGELETTAKAVREEVRGLCARFALP
jgi:glycine hydroxymethyltransferase